MTGVFELRLALFLIELVLALAVLALVFRFIEWINTRLGVFFAYVALLAWLVAFSILLTYL